MEKYLYDWIVETPYAYADLEEYEDPYARDQPFSVVNNEVHAVYTDFQNPWHQYNRCLDALPPISSPDQIKRDYTVKIPYPKNRDEIEKMRLSTRIHGIQSLSDLRIPMKYAYQLEYEFKNMLYRSYKNRYLVSSRQSNLSGFRNDETVQESLTTVSSGKGAAVTGVLVMGTSGCGKSSSISRMLERIPQVIVHTVEGYGTFCQVVYLCVHCKGSNNIKDIAVAIGEELDKAFHNLTPYYATQINTQRRSGAHSMLRVVKQLIEAYGIGAIIFEEAQELSFAASDSKVTFNAFLELINTCNIGFMIVGTEDLAIKLESNLPTLRRFNHLVRAADYCADQAYFYKCVLYLLNYQWTGWQIKDQRTRQDIADTLFTETHGLIYLLIEIYQYMQFDWLMASKKPAVNGEFVRNTVTRHFPALRRILKNVCDPLQDMELSEMMSRSSWEFYKAAQEKIEEEKKALMNDRTALEKWKIDSEKEVMEQMEDVIFLFGEKNVRRAVIKVINQEENYSKDSRMLRISALTLLRKNSGR